MGYSVLRLAQATLGTASSTLYTATASTQMLDMHAANINSVEAGVTVWIGSAGNDGESFWRTVTIPPSDFMHWSGIQYIASAGMIKGLATVASTINITITGTVLT